jgi:TonB-dependent starch-binding outer membrane protein SusC
MLTTSLADVWLNIKKVKASNVKPKLLKSMKIVVNRPVPKFGDRVKLLRIMKLTIILLTIAALQVSAHGYSQGITISKKNLSLEEALVAINKQTGYLYFANHGTLQKAKRFDLHVLNASLKQVLGICFEDQPLTYTIMDSVILIKEKPGTTSSQVTLLKEGEIFIDVKGRVLNENGIPVPGVTVTIQGTSTSTITDLNGEFSLATVDRDAVLVFSHVSMESFELKVSGKTELNVKLKTKISELDDVTITVSTGYEDIPKERATGSFTKIDNATFNKQAGTNLLNRLDGVTSGLQFNIGKVNSNAQNKTNISIRGLSTINGPLDPLIVLDGFIYEGDIANINTNDVEDITILKDAAATSIYGARGGNGVIVINTKRGKYNQKLQVSFNANVIISSKPDLFSLPQISAGDYINVEETLFNNGYFDDYVLYDSYYHYPFTPAVNVFINRRNGLITDTDSAAQINAFKAIDARDEYKRRFYTNALTKQYSINLRGGNDKNAFTFSVSYDRNRSELDDNYHKLNVKIENYFRPIKNLQLNLGVYFTNSKAVSGKPSYNSVKWGERVVPYIQFADNNGSPLSIPLSYNDTYTDTAGEGKLLDWKYYPLEDYKHFISTNKKQELLANAGIQLKLSPSLNLDLKYQYQKQESVLDQVSDLESYNTRNLINMFSQIDREAGVVTHIIPLGSIRALNNSNIESHTGRAQLNFSKHWGDHSVSAILGGEIREAKTFGNGNTVYGYNADPLSYSNVDLINSYPTFVTGDYANIPGALLFYKEVNRFVSVLTNMSYVYKSRYILSGSVRRDGSNIFGASTNDKWKPLWSAGIGWVISKEKFYKTNWLPNLKIRGTWGYSGNVDLSKSPLPIARYFNNPITNFVTARVIEPNNPGLRWEQVSQVNMGVDFSTIKNIVSGTIEYYYKEGLDLYGESPYDYTTFGQSPTITKNVANMKGRGFDVTIQSKNIDRGFRWTTILLLNNNTNKTTKYFNTSAQNGTSLIGGGNTITPAVGKPLYSIAAYKWGGLDNAGNPQGFVNGEISTDYTAIANEANSKGLNSDSSNIVFVGAANPTTFGALINTFTWKQFSISINIAYKFGYYFRRPTLSYSQLISLGSGTNDFAKRWQKPGDEMTTTVPSFIYPNNSDRDIFYQLSEINILKADHIRLQYINLTYSLNKRNHNRIPFDMEIYANASNLGILWRANKENIDPDHSAVLPPVKSWALGIRANF